MKKVDFDKLILSDSSPAQLVESYNTLRTNLCFALEGKTGCIIAVTGAKHGQGISSSAVNLAISMSQINKKVLLIDADMHNPGVSAKLGLEGKAGFSDCLRGAELAPSLQNVKGIELLPSGTPCPNPANLLDSENAAKLIADVRGKYDYVIMSLPPVNSFSDACIISKHIDGFVLVADHDRTKYREIQHMLRNLHMSDSRILGYIYNFAPGK